MPANIDYADVLHTGLHRFEQTPTLPPGSIGDTQVGTANPIGQTKLQHQYDPAYAQPFGSAAISERKVVHVARAAGSVAAFEGGIALAAVGAATVTIDLKKNGASILTSVITITNAQAAYARVAAAIASAAYVAGDVFEVVTVAAAGGGTLPQGLFADGCFREGSG